LRAKKNRVNSPENGSVRADTQSQREDADGGNERVADELRKAIAEVGKKIFGLTSEAVHGSTEMLRGDSRPIFSTVCMTRGANKC
jgi:hypothetical protein